MQKCDVLFTSTMPKFVQKLKLSFIGKKYYCGLFCEYMWNFTREDRSWISDALKIMLLSVVSVEKF